MDESRVSIQTDEINRLERITQLSTKKDYEIDTLGINFQDYYLSRLEKGNKSSLVYPINRALKSLIKPLYYLSYTSRQFLQGLTCFSDNS